MDIIDIILGAKRAGSGPGCIGIDQYVRDFLFGAGTEIIPNFKGYIAPATPSTTSPDSFDVLPVAPSNGTMYWRIQSIANIPPTTFPLIHGNYSGMWMYAYSYNITIDAWEVNTTASYTPVFGDVWLMWNVSQREWIFNYFDQDGKWVNEVPKEDEVSWIAAVESALKGSYGNNLSFDTSSNTVIAVFGKRDPWTGENTESRIDTGIPSRIVDLIPDGTNDNNPLVNQTILDAAMATVPAGGLRAPIEIELESQLTQQHLVLTADDVGLFYIIQTMDITAAGKTGKAWVNFEEGDDTKPVIWYRTFDQYYSADGLSIILTPTGQLQVNATWLNGEILAVTTGISNALTVLIDTVTTHLGRRNNPHGVTAEQAGAEPAFNVLPVSKGGTASSQVNGPNGILSKLFGNKNASPEFFGVFNNQWESSGHATVEQVRNTLNVVSKNGDTMSGTLQLAFNNPDILFHHPGNFAAYLKLINQRLHFGGFSWGDNYFPLAYLNEIPTLLSQMINDTGFVTSSGSVANATNAVQAANALNAERLNGQNWHWSGQPGQPSWLWGGSDGANMYVYNPSNFSVNYANSAGSLTATPWFSLNVAGTPHMNEPPQYRKIGNVVYLRGHTYNVQAGSDINALPVGFRPSISIAIPFMGGNYIAIDPSGLIEINGNTSMLPFVTLSGSFIAEQ
jgi:hypothetical protein